MANTRLGPLAVPQSTPVWSTTITDEGITIDEGLGLEVGALATTQLGPLGLAQRPYATFDKVAAGAALEGTATLTISAAGSVVLEMPLAGTASLTISASGSLLADVSLAGIAMLQITATGALQPPLSPLPSVPSGRAGFRRLTRLPRTPALAMPAGGRQGVRWR